MFTTGTFNLFKKISRHRYNSRPELKLSPNNWKNKQQFNSKRVQITVDPSDTQTTTIPHLLSKSKNNSTKQQILLNQKTLTLNRKKFSLTRSLLQKRFHSVSMPYIFHKNIPIIQTSSNSTTTQKITRKLNSIPDFTGSTQNEPAMLFCYQDSRL